MFNWIRQAMKNRKAKKFLKQLSFAPVEFRDANYAQSVNRRLLYVIECLEGGYHIGNKEERWIFYTLLEAIGALGIMANSNEIKASVDVFYRIRHNIEHIFENYLFDDFPGLEHVLRDTTHKMYANTATEKKNKAKKFVQV